MQETNIEESIPRKFWREEPVTGWFARMGYFIIALELGVIAGLAWLFIPGPNALFGQMDTVSVRKLFYAALGFFIVHLIVVRLLLRKQLFAMAICLSLFLGLCMLMIFLTLVLGQIDAT